MNNASIYHSNIVRIALPILAMLVVPTAQARVFNVNTTIDMPDDGLSITQQCHTRVGCTLRAAIMKANQLPGSHVINVPAGTYTLTVVPTGLDGERTGDLNATGMMRIVGQGAGSTIIDANQIDRVLTVSGNATLTGVTIRGGAVPTPMVASDGYGGGIKNLGILTISDTVIENNVATRGGGITNSGSGVLTITASVVEGNQALNQGGGIYSEGTLNIVQSTIRSNFALYHGGGIAVQGYTKIRNSTLSDNGASTVGGGIYSGGIYGEYLYVVNSTISHNYSNRWGGGIYSDGTTFLYNTTVVGNEADRDSGDAYFGTGGGVYANYFEDVWYDDYAGFITFASRFMAVNSLIADNTQGDTPTNDDCIGALEVYGFNLFGENSGCTFGGNGDSAVGLLSPNSLGPLQDNGGPTLTHALLPGSNAIDAASAQGCVNETGAVLTSDQRGVPRGIGPYCDIGAVESNEN